MAKKKVFKIVSAVTLSLVCATFVYAMATVKAEDKDSEKIAQNVYIDQIDVGGMSEAEADEAVRAYADELKNQTFTLTIDEKSVTTTGEQLGIDWANPGVVKEAYDIGKTGNIIERYKSKKDLEHESIVLDLEFAADRDTVKEYLKNNTEALNQEAVNYGLKRENGVFTMTDGQNGIAVDIDKSADKIVEYVASEWDRSAETMLALEAEVVEPEGTREQLSRVKDVLGTFTTDFSSSSAGRAQNVRNGASKINGKVLYPGEQFSVYEAVNPFSAENGYELAGSYENGTTVQTYGGGICQVSSTLYNAVIRAEMQIDERFCHSMIVSYVQPSMDAAIAGTYKDLKFTNQYDFPIYIEGYTNGGLITFTIYGEETRDAGREVIFESETTSTTEPPTEYVIAADQQIGSMATQQSAHTGYTAKLWKIVKENGVEVSREVYNNSTYRASAKIVAVGVASASEEASAAVKKAVESQDEATIQAAIAANNAEALEQAAQEEEDAQEESGEQEATEDKKPPKHTEETKDEQPKTEDATDE